MSRRRPATCLAAIGLLALSACAGSSGEDVTDSGTDGSSSSSSSTPEPTPPFDTGSVPIFGGELTQDVSDEELQEALDDDRLPPGPTHGTTFEVMTNAITLQEPHDVMLFGDSMTQQGVDPARLGERLSEQAGEEVTVFDAASSRARWGINKMMVQHAINEDRLPKVAVVMISTRAPENDDFYSSEIQKTPFSHAVEGCDREISEQWTEADAEECRRDVDDLAYRFRDAEGRVERALAGEEMPQDIIVDEDSRLLDNGYLAHPSVSEAKARETGEKRATRGGVGWPHNEEQATGRFTEMVQMLEDEGVTVISAEIPYTPGYQDPLEREYPGYDERRQTAAANLADSAGIEHFPVDAFGDWWGDGSSRDEIHLAPEGAADFADQLVDDTPGFADAVTAGLE